MATEKTFVGVWIVLCTVCSCESSSADVRKKLRYFETLCTTDIAVRKRRSTETGQPDQHEISFPAFGRKFRLVLSPGSPPMVPEFETKTVDRHGREMPLVVQQGVLYTGFLADDRSVTVSAHHEDGVLSAVMRFPRELYVVEPAWRHLSPDTNCSMLVYRASDVLGSRINHMDVGLNIGSLGILSGKGDFNDSLHRLVAVASEKSRQKRAGVEGKICLLFVVVDYDFYREVGVTERNTVLYLTQLLHNVHQRYRKTVWEAKGMTGYGLRVAKMLIHTEYTSTPGHYNLNKTWGSREKLRAFIRHARDMTTFCLAHLFTSTAFTNHVHGVAVTASPDPSDPQGICGPSFYDAVTGSMVSANAAATTARTSAGFLLKIPLELVISHEIGHNWGANHDPVTAECSPATGGKFLMSDRGPGGYEANNERFSPCSKRDVASVLKTKSRCFVQDASAGFSGLNPFRYEKG